MSRKKKREEKDAYETVEPPPALDPEFPYRAIAFDPGFFEADFDIQEKEETNET